MRHQAAHRAYPSANINLKCSWIAFKVAEPALGQIVRIRKQIGKGERGGLIAHAVESKTTASIVASLNTAALL